METGAAEAAEEGLPAGRSNRRRVGINAAVGFLALVLIGSTVWLISGNNRADEIEKALRAGDLATAERLARAWVKARPSSAGPLRWMARVELAARNDPGAAEHYREARRLGAEVDAEMEGVLLARAGKLEEAEPLLRRALAETDQPRPLAAEALAKLGAATYRFGVAREGVDRWERDAPTDPAAPLFRAKVAELIGSDAETRIGYYTRALQLDPENAEANLALGAALLEANRPEEAEKVFREQLRKDAKSARALAGAGSCAAALGRDEECRKFFEAALTEDPDQLEALKGLAQVELRAGRPAKAVDLLERAIRLEPDDFELMYSAALALARAGRTDEAARRRAEADRMRAEGEEIRSLRDAVLKEPANPDRLLAVARWLIDHDHADEGVRWAERALTLSPGHGPTCQLLANHYEKAGQAGLANFYRAKMSGAARPR